MPLTDVDQQSMAIDLPQAFGKAGALITADVDGDQQRDFVITQPDYMAAYSLNRGQLWEYKADIWLSSNSETKGLPGLHAPGIQVGDIDNDETLELLYLTADNELHVLAADTGNLKYQVDLPPVDASNGHWEHAILANFQGGNDADILLQASRPTDRDDYLRDSLQAAFQIDELLSQGSSAVPLWSNESFVSLSHGAPKVVDINGDGQDEVVGGTILGADGDELYRTDIENTAFPHIDSIAIDDIDPNRPGLEAVIPEERGRQRVILFDDEGMIWTSDHRQRADDNDGDKVAIGNFDPTKPGLEIWFRGSDSEHFTVLDARGEVIASYRFLERRPDAWTEKGLEVINRIRWTGDEKEYIVAKERHEAGDVGIFDAMTGQLVAQFPNQTERLYVADVLGDWREEIVVVSNDELTVYHNQAPNPNPGRSSLWADALYRRNKMTWNYYSP
jgi:hypothetical protein